MQKIKEFLYSLTIISFIKVFFIGLVCQFILHTFVTYIIHVPDTGVYSVIWMRKEILIIGLGIWSIYHLFKNQSWQQTLLHHKRLSIVVIVTIISILISFATSLFVHHQSVMTFFLSAKFNYFPIVIMIVGGLLGIQIKTQEHENITDTIITIIKYVIIFSIIRYGILHTFPNVLDWIGYSQPGASIERTADTPPPSLWLTEFYTGYVRNQGPFSGPLSLGFYMVCFFPLFFTKVLYKKKLSDTRYRWVLYGFTTISTFSRAAWIMWIIQLLLIAMIAYRRYMITIIISSIVILSSLVGYAIVSDKTDIFMRRWSDQGHEKFLNEGIAYVQENWLRGKGAASVGPASYHNDDGSEAFNTENQYMQVWVEYGLVGFLSWVVIYIIIGLLSGRRRWLSWNQKNNFNESHLVRAGPFISLAALSIGSMALHPLTDSSSMYPFMMMIGLSRGEWGNKSLDILKNNTSPSRIWLSIGKVTTILILLFFIIQTQVVNGWGLLPSSLMMSSMRDIGFLTTAIITLVLFRKHLLSFIQTYKHLLIVLALLIIWSVISGYIHSPTTMHLLAGMKFDLSYLLIIIIGLRRGHCIGQSISGTGYLLSFFQRLRKTLPWIIIAGILWQGAKILWPDFFIDYGGYGLPGDFAPWSHPPLYYITGPGGIPRLSGLFVGPNTLGFFLILFGGGWLYQIWQQSKKWSSSLLALGGYIICIIATLSRSAILAVTIQALTMTLLPFIQGGKILRGKLRLYLLKRIIGVLSILSFAIISIIFMNQWKNTSNTERMSSLEQSYTLLSTNPRSGYGPGYVGPARHYHPDYILQPKNTFALVENIYAQIWVNLGLPGFLLRLCIWFLIIRYVWKATHKDYDHTMTTLKSYLIALSIGLLSLLVVGRFLDVFIDSMVNYIFFTIFAILIGLLYKKSNEHRDHAMSIK